MRWVLSYTISGLLHVSLWGICLICARVSLLPQTNLSQGETFVTELTWAAAESAPTPEVSVELFPEPLLPESEPETPLAPTGIAAAPTTVTKQKTKPLVDADFLPPAPIASEVTTQPAETVVQSPAKQPDQLPDSPQPPAPQPRTAAPASVATPFMRPTVAGALSTSPPRNLPFNLPPAYPSDALRASIEGAVFIRASISVAGEVAAAEIESSSGSSSLDAAALAAIRHWRFEPAQLLGVPVAMEVRIPIRFSIKRS